MARYVYTQESGTDFKVSIADKCDALEDSNQVRQILDDLGELLGHSKFNDSYPADGTSGGDIDIRRVTTKSTVATLTTGEAGFVKVSAAAGYSLTLPTAVGNKLTYIFVKTDANTNLITIDGGGTETINGSLTYTDLNYQYAYVAIRSDNANWFVLFRSTNNLVTKTGTLVVGDLVKVNNASGIVEPTGIVAADVVKKTGTFTAGKVAKINNASGIIEMATNTDTEVAAAVTEKHTHPIVDTTGIAKGSVDATKIVRFEVDGLTTGTTRVLTVPDKDLTLVGTVDKLSVFAATTSAELAGVISDETGTGLLVYGTSPNITTPTGIVKNDVGLGNVDNTADTAKPVSTATQTALNLKANLASPTFTGIVTIPTPFTLGAVSVLPTGTELNYVDGVTSAIQTQLNTKLANIVEDTTPQLGGELDAQAHSIGFTQQSATGDGTTTIDWKLGNKFYFTFGAANEVFTFTAPTKPCNLILVLKQDGTGSRLATWPATVMFPAGIKPTLTTTANAVDIIAFYYNGTNYFGVASLAFAVPV